MRTRCNLSFTLLTQRYRHVTKGVFEQRTADLVLKYHTNDHYKDDGSMLPGYQYKVRPLTWHVSQLSTSLITCSPGVLASVSKSINRDQGNVVRCQYEAAVHIPRTRSWSERREWQCTGHGTCLTRITLRSTNWYATAVLFERQHSHRSVWIWFELAG